MRRYWHGADDGTAVKRARKRVNCAVLRDPSSKYQSKRKELA